ncbi:MAG TPA: Ig-like domain repeat protein [Chloroflexia bacterium]|nr:Ig-like domain repeat protein [Chloroflexia bacterium]
MRLTKNPFLRGPQKTDHRHGIPGLVASSSLSGILRVWVVLALVIPGLALAFYAAPQVHAANITVSTVNDTLDAASATCTAITPASLPGPDGVTSLREAICAANNTPGSVITFGVNGTFKLTRVNPGGTPDDDATYGDLDILQPVTITGNGATNTVIDGNLTDRVFDINPLDTNPLTVTLSGVTIQNGQVDPTLFNIGAGIAVSPQSTLILNNSTIKNNTVITGNGAGIYNNGTLTLNNDTFSGNTAQGDGGGVYSVSTLTINGSTFNSNTAENGGGVFTGTNVGINVSITDSTFSSNVAKNQNVGTTGPTGRGGGLISDTDGSIAIKSSTFSANSATTNGAGLYLRQTSTNPATFSLTNSTVSGNSGNGIYKESGRLTLESDTIYSNTSAGIVNSTALTTLHNTLVAGAQSGGDLSGVFTSNNYNIVANAAGATIIAQPGDKFNAAATPLNLGPLQNNGGPTLTHALLPGSVAYNSGDPANPAGLSTDQRGQARVQGGRMDIGSFELNLTPTTLSVAPVTAPYGSSVTLTATLMAGATPLNGQTVNFTLNGSSVGSAVTNASGVATLNNVSLAGINAGSYPNAIAASYAGGTISGTSYAASSGTANLTVTAATTATAVDPATVAYQASSASTVSLKATVTATSAGTPVVTTGKVLFTVTQGATTIGTATSGNISNGVATVNYSIPAGTPAGSYTISGVYTDTASNFSTSNGSNTLTITPAGTTTTPANASAFFGAASVILTANVTSPAGTVNGGSVNFTVKQGATVIGTATAGTVTNGAASVIYPLPAGTASGNYTITADYTPTGDFTASSGSATLTINPASTTVAVSNATATYGDSSVNLSATVTSAAGTVNTGTVTFTIKQGATVIGTATTGPVSNGAASVTYTLPAGTAAGAYTIEAAYSGGGDFAASNGTGNLTINQAAAAINVSPASASYGAGSVTLQATVTSGGNPVTAGNVTFTVKDSANATVGTATSGPVNASGVASVSYTLPAGLATGAYTINASYGGSTNFSTITGTGTLTINPASTSVVVSPASATFGASSVTLSATVTSGGNPVTVGSVDFTIKQGATVIGTTTSGPLNGSGVASVSYTLPAGTAAGAYTIEATFAGDANYSASNGSNTLTIGQASTVTGPSNASAVYGATSVTLTATVTSGGNPVTTGSVDFTVKQGATVIGTTTTVALNGSGVASVSYTLPAGTAAGAYTIDATYTGSTNFATSNGTATLNITQASTTTTVTDQTVVYGASSVTLTASVTSPAGTVNSGTVTFTVKDSSNATVGTATSGPVNASGVASVSYTLPAGLAAGSYTITALYNGSTNFAGSTGSGTLTIGPAPTTLTVLPAGTTYGSTIVTLAASLSSGGTGVGGVTMNFTVKQGATVIGTTTSVTVDAAGNASVAYILPAGLPAGNYTVDATFAGDSNYQASSGSNTVTISKATAGITLGNLAQVYDGTAKVPSASTNPANLTVVFSYSQGGTGVASAINAGTYDVLATINDPNYSGSTTGQLVIAKSDTALALTSSANPSSFNQNVTFTATVSAVAPGGGTPAGSVTFKADGNVIGAGAVTLSGGKATVQISSLVLGSHVITADYSGDANYNVSSNTLNQQVNPGAAGSFVVTAPATTVAGAAFSVTVTAVDAFGNTDTAYTGTVQLTSSDAQGVMPVNYTFLASDKGVFTFTGVILKTAGTQTITATSTATPPITGTSSGILVTADAGGNLLLKATGGSGQSTPAGTPFTQPLKAVVTDSFGNPVQGVTVTFSAPASGASATFPNGNTATSDASGLVAVNASANSVQGSYSVSASAPKVATPASFSLTNCSATGCGFGDVGVSLTANHLSLDRGDNVVLTVTVKNYGPQAVSGLVITSLLPAGLKYISHQAGAGTSYDPTSGLWNVGNLANGASITLTITAKVQFKGYLTVTASRTAMNEPDNNPANDSASLTLSTNKDRLPANLVGKLRVSPDRSFNLNDPNAELVYTLQIKNTGPGIASYPKVRFPLSSMLVLTGATFNDDRAWVSAIVLPGDDDKHSSAAPRFALYLSSLKDQDQAGSNEAGGKSEGYIELTLPAMEPGKEITANLSFKPAGFGKAVGGTTLFTRFTMTWDDETGAGKHHTSNAVRVKLDSIQDDHKDNVQALNSDNPRVKSGETVKVSGDFFAQDEKVLFWYTDDKGKSTSLDYGYADREGRLPFDFKTIGLAPGTYVLVSKGVESEIQGTIVITVD